MKGYWHDEERKRESIVDGWMHTADLAMFDDEGYCSIVSRAKDMTIRGGENIYPREIEEFLFKHPVVATIQVFGVPHEKFGEQVCTWIVFRDGSSLDEKAVQQYCEGQIVHNKILNVIQFIVDNRQTSEIR